MDCWSVGLLGRHSSAAWFQNSNPPWGLGQDVGFEPVAPDEEVVLRPLHIGQIQCERRFYVKGHFAAVAEEEKRPRDVNPNGIPSLSPGLRGTSYPGSATAPGLQP